MWIFKGIADFNEPILPETPAMRFGCVGPMALAVSRDDEMFWIGEDRIYRMKIGADGPTAIDTPGMFEEIMNKAAASWVESQSTYNMPLLTIDHADKDIWLYTQKGKIYIYNLDTKMWSYLDSNPAGTSAEVRSMIFDPVSNRMLVSFGGQGATRFDETCDAQDTIVAGGGTPWNILSEVVPKPFELFAPRYEASLLEVGLFHNATIQQGSITIAYSYDRGATYTARRISSHIVSDEPAHKTSTRGHSAHLLQSNLVALAQVAPATGASARQTHYCVFIEVRLAS